MARSGWGGGIEMAAFCHMRYAMCAEGRWVADARDAADRPIYTSMNTTQV